MQPKLVIGVLVALIAGLFLYRQLGEQPLTTRQAIEEGVALATQDANISESEKQQLRAQLAVADYTAKNGRPPASIEDLVPKYFDAVPVDPISGEKLSLGMSAPTKVAKGKKGGKKKSADEELGGEGFINPNTMAVSDFVYDPLDKRDPFETFDFSGDQTLDTSLPPLQRYSLGQLKVTAILKQPNGEYSAFIEDVTGVGYPAKKGTNVGSNAGVVVKITEDSVFVVEQKKDFTGKMNRSTIEMKIQRVNTGSKNENFQRVRNRKGAKKGRRR